MIIAEFAIFPTSEGPSASRYVKRALAAISATGIRHETGAMATVMEAQTLDEIFEAVRRAHEAVVSMGVKRIHIDLRIDHRLDKEISIESKKRAIQ